MPKQKPENQLTDEEQAKRFREAAKKAGVDADKAEKAFDSLSEPLRKRGTESSPPQDKAAT